MSLPRRRFSPPPHPGHLLLRLAFAALLGVLAWHVWSGTGNSVAGGSSLARTASALWLRGSGEEDPAAASRPGTVRICSEECGAPYSRNGVCDDGRMTPAPGNASASSSGAPGAPAATEDPGGQRSVHCDLGTDCADCGAFEAPAGDPARWRPIAEIRAKGFPVFARRSTTPWPFWMAFTDPKMDVDVSSHFSNSGIVERGITRVWHKILDDGCRPQAAEAAAADRRLQGLVLDVGANFGWFSLLSAAAGCKVVAWEPVPYFAAFLKYGLLRSGLAHQVQLRETIVSDVPGTLEMLVPQRGIWGTAGIGGANIDASVDNEGDLDHVLKRTERIDDVLAASNSLVEAGDVLLLKVDVEGFEPGVLRSAKKLLLDKRRQLENIILEYSPGVAERAFNWTWFEEFPAMLYGLARAGYGIAHLEDAQGGGDGADWREPLPQYEQVTAEVLAHDLDDARRLQEGKLGCLAPEVSSAGLYNCGALPEGIDPHSFRSVFGHNTNIWAHRHKGGAGKPWEAPSPRLATLFPPNHTSFFSPHDRGAARRTCAHIEPVHQLRHRCRCSDAAVCGEAQGAVERLDEQGKLKAPPVQRPWKAEALDIERWKRP